MKNTAVYILIIIFIGAMVWALATQKAAAPIPAENTTVNNSTTLDSNTETTPQPVEKKTITNPTLKNTMHIQTTHEGTGVAIVTGQTVVVDYTGKLADGSIFDASKNHGGTFEFALGAGKVIAGWEQGVLGMKVGETRVLTIPPELAYGPMGYPPVIPPNATLTFDVTLVEIK